MMYLVNYTVTQPYQLTILNIEEPIEANTEEEILEKLQLKHSNQPQEQLPLPQPNKIEILSAQPL